MKRDVGTFLLTFFVYFFLFFLMTRVTFLLYTLFSEALCAKLISYRDENDPAFDDVISAFPSAFLPLLIFQVYL